MNQSNDGAATPGGVLGEGQSGGRVLWTPAPGAGPRRGRWEEPLRQVNMEGGTLGRTPPEGEHGGGDVGKNPRGVGQEIGLKTGGCCCFGKADVGAIGKVGE